MVKGALNTFAFNAGYFNEQLTGALVVYAHSGEGESVVAGTEGVPAKVIYQRLT